MEFVNAEHNVEYIRSTSSGELQQKRVDWNANESRLEGLTRRSMATQASNHSPTPTTYPTMLDRVLLAVSSSAQSTLPSGTGSSTLLNNPSNAFNASTVEALRKPIPLSSSVQSTLPSGTGSSNLLNNPSNAFNTTAIEAIRKPIPPPLVRAALAPSLGITNHDTFRTANSIALAMQHEKLSELLRYSHENAVAKIHRSALFPYASASLAMVNALAMNRLSPSQVLEQQLFERHLLGQQLLGQQLFKQQLVSRPGMSQLDSLIAGGFTNGVLPSLQLASEVTSTAGLPSFSPHLVDVHFGSSDSSITRRSGVPLEHKYAAQLNGVHESFPMILHRALSKPPQVRGGSDIASFLPDGLSFRISDKIRFENEILPRFFPRMKEFGSFQRQLNLYNFRRLGGSGLDRRSYSHAFFVRHHPELARSMRRTRVKRIARPPAEGD